MRKDPARLWVAGGGRQAVGDGGQQQPLARRLDAERGEVDVQLAAMTLGEPGESVGVARPHGTGRGGSLGPGGGPARDGWSGGDDGRHRTGWRAPTSVQIPLLDGGNLHQERDGCRAGAAYPGVPAARAGRRA